MTVADMTFNQWLNHIFDHPVTDPAWHWGADYEPWYGPAATIVDYLTQTFSQAGTVLAAFSDAQVNQGLWYLVDFSCSNYMVALQSDGPLPDTWWPYGEVVPLEARLRCIDAMATLFRDCFAPRCTPHLSHLDEAGASPLNAVCYMWWDILPLHGMAHHHPDWPNSAALDEHILAVIEQGLSLPSDACRESALHGCGEWSCYYPQRIAQMVDNFLAAHPDLRPELRAYALRARDDGAQ